MAYSTSRGTILKKVLVELGDDSLPVSFVSGAVSDYQSVRESIAIKAGVDADDLILKVKSEEFGGRWVNLTEEDAVPDKSVIMCVVRTSKPQTHPPDTSAAISATATMSTQSRPLQTGATTHTQMRLSFTHDSLQLRKPMENEIICVSSDSIPKNAELDTESIRDKAKIYTKSNLNDYQKRINSASADLCMHNPALLLGKKGELLKLAQEKVHQDGYQYKKGKSRSKRYSVPEDDTQTKRPRLDSATRHERMMELQDLISDIDRSIGFKQRRIETATATHNFKTCDELSQEISSLKAERREHTAELALLQKKTTKSSWYHKHKGTRATSIGPSNIEESDDTPIEVGVDKPESNSNQMSGDILDLTGESEVDSEMCNDPESSFYSGLPAPK